VEPKSGLISSFNKWLQCVFSHHSSKSAGIYFQFGVFFLFFLLYTQGDRGSTIFKSFKVPVLKFGSTNLVSSSITEEEESSLIFKVPFLRFNSTTGVTFLKDCS
jgi:hypothetical protein